MTEPVPAAEGTAKKPQFAIQRLYCKDISFEAPGTPGIFTQNWEPDTNVQFSSAATKVSDAQYEIVLQLTVKTTLKDKVAYIAEVRFAGIFLISGFEAPAVEHIIGAQCPNILFPYAREVISDLVNRGSFPQFLLQPMNFDAVFAEAKRRQQEAATAAAPASTH
jgi:preprotein translocase subunit SecB